MSQTPNDDILWRLQHIEKRLGKLEALIEELQTYGRGLATKNDVRYVKEELQDFEGWTRHKIRELGGSVS